VRLTAVRRDAGMALVLVLVFALLLTSSIATFVRRSVIDGTIVERRDALAEAETLARGGVQLAMALRLEDRLREQAAGFRIDTRQDVWARIGREPLDLDGARLTLRVRDAGARLNLNALLDEEGKATEHSEILLTQFLGKVVAEMPGQPEEKEYDVPALARNLLDYLDADGTSPRGDVEDDYYQQQDPPYRAANRPLLSLDELGLVQGFDRALIEAIEPYATVYPYAGGGGINPNTAPPHVLALLYSQDALDASGSHLAPVSQVQQILDVRDDASIFCEESFEDPNRGLLCIGLGEIVPGQVFPAPTFENDWFTVEAEAEVGGVVRVVEATIDRTDPSQPRLLSWRVR